MNSRQFIQRMLGVLLASLMLVACDGGIFGTGGPDTIMTGAPNAEAPGDQMPNAGGTDAAGNPGESTDSPDSSITTDGSFENTQGTLDDGRTLLRLVNASDASISVTQQTPDRALFSTIPGNTVTGVVEIDSGIVSLLASSGDDRTVVFRLSPLELAEATLTTLLVRSDGPQLEIVPVRSSVKASDATLVQVRVLQGTRSGDIATGATLRLLSAGANPGGVDIDFSNITFDKPASDYQEIPAGDYELLDVASRFAGQALSFSGDNAYTIVLNTDASGSAPTVQLINDSNLALQPE